MVEKAVDCLRIITTGNDANKRALVDIPIALPGLTRLLSQPKAVRSSLMCFDLDRQRTLGGAASRIRLSQPHSWGPPSQGPPACKRIICDCPDAARLHQGTNDRRTVILVWSCCWSRQVVTERAVAVIGNLSTSSEYFGALREAGVLQKLVRLCLQSDIVTAYGCG